MNIENNFTEHSMNHMVHKFKTKSLSITSFLEKLFDYIEQSNPTYNAVTTLEKEHAFARAKKLEAMDVQASHHLKLFGIPVLIKENIQKVGFSVECASKILKGYRGQYNASAIEKLEAEGAIIIGTANMDEFAMGASNEHSTHGPVRNPYDTSLMSGGSSGGPAVACALGYSPLTLGSETGGSVRVPAAFCGVFGFKPTYGRVSRYGLVAYGSSLDQISPFTRTAKDLDTFFQVVGVKDPNDATTLEESYVSVLDSGKQIEFSDITIGVPRSLITKDVEDDVLEAFHALETQLQKRGVKFKDINIEGSEHALSAYYVVACAEASSNLARFDGIRYGVRAQDTTDLHNLYCKTRSEGFGFEVKKRIMLGTFALSAGYYDAFYGRAQAVRQMLSASLQNVFKDVDFIYLPTTPTTAPKIGINNKDPLKEYLYDMFTVIANLAHIPAISMPANCSQKMLPIGLQLIGAKEHDAKLIAFAHRLEEEKLVGVRHD